MLTVHSRVDKLFLISPSEITSDVGGEIYDVAGSADAMGLCGISEIGDRLLGCMSQV